VPRLLRAAPRNDLDQAAATETIVAQRFFSRSRNESGGEVADLTLAANGLVVEDRTHGRMWAVGCIDPDTLPHAPPLSGEELGVRYAPEAMQTDAQRALIATRRDMRRRMRLAIEDVTASFNRLRTNGYDDWRLPTLEEAMSLVTRNTRRDGLHVSEFFSNHEGIRTADRSPGHLPVTPGLSKDLFESTWIVTFRDGDCGEVGEEAAIPLRFVRTHLD